MAMLGKETAEGDPDGLTSLTVPAASAEAGFGSPALQDVPVTGMAPAGSRAARTNLAAEAALNSSSEQGRDHRL